MCSLYDDVGVTTLYKIHQLSTSDSPLGVPKMLTVTSYLFGYTLQAFIGFVPLTETVSLLNEHHLS
jgi:hypothetical protein